MTSIINKSFTTLIAFLLFSGCLSLPQNEDSESKPECEEKIILSHEDLVERDSEKIVVANVRHFDNAANLQDVLIFTEPVIGSISMIDLPCEGDCQEINLSSETFQAPVRVDAADLDADGVNELIVADIGILPPSNSLVGQVVILDYDEGTGEFTEQVIIGNIGRTTCAEAVDLDADGDLDLTLCEFGDDNGSVGWLENNGEQGWEHHEIDNRAGSIVALSGDFDNDGDQDIVSVISQLTEEVTMYWNDGEGNFSSETLYKANTTFYGMSGLRIVDIEGDGDLDILFTNGDVMDFDFPSDENFWDYHGLALLENNQASFSYQKLVYFSGAYDSLLFDIDKDGEDEIILIGFRPNADGTIDFGTHPNFMWLDYDDSAWIPNYPSSDIAAVLISLAIADIDGDGIDDLIAANHDYFSNTEISGIMKLELTSVEICE